MTPDVFARWLTATGGRRFALTVGCSFINSILFAVGILSENGYLMILGGTVFTYVASNTTQKIKNKEVDA